jgi:hypothetical protein
VSALTAIVLLAGIAVEIALVGCLLRKGLWRRYPAFSIYVLCVVGRTLLLVFVQKLFPGSYTGFYWESDSVGLGLRFLVVWEVFRHTFPKGSVLQRTMSKGFGVFGMGLLILAVGSFWSFETYSKIHSVYPALERSFGFAQAVLILGVLLTARYYGVQLGRNVWGMAVAFGAWISMSTANNAMIDLAHSFLPYWRLLRPLSFVAMFAVWTWAMWVYAPNPPLAADEQLSQEPGIDWWEKNWNRTISATRKVMHS